MLGEERILDRIESDGVWWKRLDVRKSLSVKIACHSFRGNSNIKSFLHR
jgi:hypothetical protein